jgi:hypothetical protein
MQRDGLCVPGMTNASPRLQVQPSHEQPPIYVRPVVGHTMSRRSGSPVTGDAQLTPQCGDAIPWIKETVGKRDVFNELDHNLGGLAFGESFGHWRGGTQR